MMFETILLVATLLCALTAGLVYTFWVVVMPGIRRLPDREFLRAFAVMDRVIQQNDPRFLVVWAGSVVALLVSVWLGMGHLEGLPRLLLVGTAVVYLLGVQGPTIAVNVPLNNRLQQLDLGALDAPALASARSDFEGRWVFWNTFRTFIACGCVVALLVVLVRL
ncbi:MAG: DUF1772 domain-containing protein [Bacteroidetes bacterium]|nr:hypothetical protein AWN76_004830 [Rhodothermaceae bacterium RA]RMH68326.1 MAG: DUF1772 domain-containing protein [Bacteroidota bacterium]